MPAQPEVVAADVGDHRDVAAVEAEAGAQMPPRAVSSTAESTAGFFSTIWALDGAAHVAGGDLRPVDVDAVGGGHADRSARASS